VIVDFDDDPEPLADPTKCWLASCPGWREGSECVQGFPPEKHATTEEIKAQDAERTAWLERQGKLAKASDDDEESEAKPAEPIKLNEGEFVLAEKDGETLVGVLASSIKTEPIEWLWTDRLPKKIVIVCGKPDSGKSVVCLDWIATVTTGRDWPDGAKNAGGAKKALWMGTEDKPQDTVVPRLQAAGADLSKVIILKQMKRLDDEGKPISSRMQLDRDIPLLRRTLKAHPDIKMVVLDPMPGFYGEADGNKDSDIRPIMESLAATCDKYGVTLVGIVHLNKRPDANSLEKIKGAAAVAEVARVVWGFSRDAEDRYLYHMAKVKGNLSKKRSGIDYRIEDAVVEVQCEKKIYPKVVWGEENEADADDQLAAERDRSGERRADRKRDKAMEWLLAALAEKPLASEEVFKRGAELGFSRDAIYRAKAVDKESGDPKIHCWQAVKGGQWFWSLKKRSEGVAEVSLGDVAAL